MTPREIAAQNAQWAEDRARVIAKRNRGFWAWVCGWRKIEETYRNVGAMWREIEAYERGRERESKARGHEPNSPIMR